MNNIRAVIFDIDGTISPENSWTAFTDGLGASVESHLSIYKNHLDGSIGLDESEDQLMDLWRATGNANKPHIEAMYEEWPLREEAKSVVDWLKASGYMVCLITGSVDLYAAHIASRLRIEDYYANASLHFDKDMQFVGFDYTADQADVKLQQLEDYCKKNSLSITDCMAVGDGENDIELFKATGRGVLIKNGAVSEGLGRAAWKTIANLNEIPDLLNH